MRLKISGVIPNDNSRYKNNMRTHPGLYNRDYNSRNTKFQGCNKWGRFSGHLDASDKMKDPSSPSRPLYKKDKMASNSDPMTNKSVEDSWTKERITNKKLVIEKGSSGKLDVSKDPSDAPCPLSELKKSKSRVTSKSAVTNWTNLRDINKKLNGIIVKPYHVDLMKVKDVKEFTHRLKHMVMLLELSEKIRIKSRPQNNKSRESNWEIPSTKQKKQEVQDY